MNRRLLTVVGATALLLGSALPAATTAASPAGSRQFTRLDVSKIDPQISPAILSNKPVTVMVQLKAAAAISGKTSKAQQRATARTLKATQDKLKASIVRAGGTVLGQYQYAYNGIKVRIAGRGVAALAALPGVAGIRAVPTYAIENVESVPFTGAPAAWADLGVTGAGQTIAVIDTGTDYTHANFGGPGTVAAFKANDPTKIEAGSFPTAKVIGGWDFAGNGYDADGKLGSATPSPDPDPLDCNGHGSHTSGTAAGDGVLSSGATYTGPYDSTTYTGHDFTIGPGVAPQATIVALKVFGCEGTTNLVIDALEWVAAYNANPANAATTIDVVNMSLGSTFGRGDNPDSVATDNLVGDGVVVVASAGNGGPNAYMTGSPAAATKAISVAAEDSLPSFPGAKVDFATATDITNASNQNASPNVPVTGTLKVIKDATGAVSLGCTKADYGTLAPNTIVAIQRGVCVFVDKGAAAQAAGAIGIIDINRDDLPAAALPTFIGFEPELFDIPMIGVGNESKAGIIAADGQSVTLSQVGTIANPTFKQIASFSSGGPRNGDSAAKPDVAAPGSNIISTLVGSGNQGTTLSGTSMASPHIAGVAALVHAANPSWSPLAVKAAIVGTASAAAANISPYNVRTAGSGAVQAREAVDTVAYATTPDGTASLSYGYDPTSGAYSETLAVTIHNTSASPITYNLVGASIVSVSPASVTVPAGGTASVNATAALTAAQMNAQPTTSVLQGGAPWGGVNTFRGAVVATPTSSGAGIYSLRVPFIAVPRALSNVVAGSRSAYATANGIARASIPLTNSGVHTGFADVYAWGLSDPQDLGSSSRATDDIRAVGVQVVPTEVVTRGAPDPTDRGLIFAVNTWGHWSTASSNEFDIAIFGANKHKPDFIVVGVDFGIVTAGAFNGQFASFVFDSANHLVDAWVADGPANGSTALLPLLASDIGQTVNNTRFSYSITGFSVEDSSLVDSVAGQAEFNTFHPALSTGEFGDVAAGSAASIPVAVDKGFLSTAPAKGWMVVTLDDANGAAQADLVGIGTP